MKTFEVSVDVQPRGTTSPRDMKRFTWKALKASSARVALNRGIQCAQYGKYCTDSEIRGATVREVK